MLLSRSLRRKLLATMLGAVGFLLLYQATVVDSRTVPGARVPTVVAGTRLEFVATAYCKGQVTASGVAVKSGMAAADPSFLPQGSIVQIEGVPAQHRGIYTVLDTGPGVQGRHLDLYMWSCHEALSFGRRAVKVTVLRHGWKPNAFPPNAGRPLDAPPGYKPPPPKPEPVPVAPEPSPDSAGEVEGPDASQPDSSANFPAAAAPAGPDPQDSPAAAVPAL